LENECESLRNAAETLKQERAEAKKLAKMKLLQFAPGFKIIACIIAKSFMIFILISRRQ
jgi:hypothetical protein